MTVLLGGDTCAVLTVWMAAWQLQCCGAAFSVGDTVEWTLAPVDDPDAITAGIGRELAETVTHSEDHHGLLLPDDAPRTNGTVRSIRAIDGGRESATAPAIVTAVSSANGWEPNHDGARFAGYLIELDAP